ncbi:MAG: alpha/beta hydrolase [Acidobacteria bacterium]|nr:MAG: alpha/beta hydrolase [Acidobacteriota bacterium]
MAEARRDHLVWSRTKVDGRVAGYGVAGDGPPLVFVHGWGLGQHAYKRAMKRLVNLGMRVYTPAMPGFGGTAELPASELSIAGYAKWLDGFMEAVGIDEPAFVMGHSFGGGVSLKLAHDYPDRVKFLVLINSVGGSAWTKDGSVVKQMKERPLWDWGIHFPGDIMPVGQIRKVLPVILEDALPNILRNPLAMWKAANLARRADLREELENLKKRELPVLILWGDHDKIITEDSFIDMCEAIGLEGDVISGGHSWLLADPDAFGEVMTNVLAVARIARDEEASEAVSRVRHGGVLAGVFAASEEDQRE